MRHLSFLLLLLLLVSMPPGMPAASATTVYKCTGADGRVTFQDKPCARVQRQETIQLADPAPVSPPPPGATADESATAAPEAPPPPPPQPAAPLPRLYACTSATDGKAYISRNGQPQPYLAPFGMLGMVQQPLARAYGPGGGGASAPELNRGKVTSGLVSGNYVWVQDQCRPLSFDETCRTLQNDYDDNARKLRRAFKSDRPPLEQRDEELRRQLANCR